ncbi:flavohemoglobin expression-modulating QEGLA motif protein [Planctomycetota bacterium]
MVKKRKPKSKEQISQTLIDAVGHRIKKNLRVRRTLPIKGRLHIDRQLPFLCVYRQPATDEDAGTEFLVKGEAAYLVAPGAPRFHRSVSALIHKVVDTLSAEFGAFLIVEVWAGTEGGKANNPAVPTVLPTFAVHAPDSAGMTRSVDALERQLKRIKVLKQGVKVDVTYGGRAYPPSMRPLLTVSEAREQKCTFLGVAVPPVYRKPHSRDMFPLLIRLLRRNLSLALRQAYYEFMRSHTTQRPRHYHALGRKAVVRAVWRVDRQLAAVSNQFDYLLQLTPVNTRSAWKQFERAHCERVPEFHYRPLPIDPALLKRALYKIPIERVEDPALQRLFQEKQEELELKLSMLRDRDTPRFLHESLQLFGGVQEKLFQLAKTLLVQLPRKDSIDKGPKVDAQAFAGLVEKEIAFYREACPEFTAKAQVTDTVSGLIASHGKLLINTDLSLTPSRVKSLLAHEVGTHLVTYYNGRLQPFQQLYSGLAGYEELQEGMAVLSEYLVGGLSRSRMRQLAGRVVAVRCLTESATFVETFRVLNRDYRFKRNTAYTITMRVFRGGGLTKDAVYLRGLEAILQYVQKDGNLDPLLVGKMAVEHIPIIKELLYRKVLQPAPIVPRYLQNDAALQRLARLHGGQDSVIDLISPRQTKRGDAG